MKEIRSLAIPLKVERDSSGEPKSIVGYPIVYNKDSENMGFIERIAPGAAKKALKISDIRGLKNHDPNLIFGRKGVNMKFVEDDKGVRYEATPLNTRNFKDIAEEIDAGLLTGQSFAFTISADEWKDLKTDTPKRTITEFGEIFDVGPVTYPAYNDTTVALRSLDKAKKIDMGDTSISQRFTPIPNDDQKQITITDNDAIFAFDSLEQFDRVAQKVAEIRAASGPTSATVPTDPPAGPTSDEGFPQEMETLEERMSQMDERISKVSIFAQIKEIEAI